MITRHGNEIVSIGQILKRVIYTAVIAFAVLTVAGVASIPALKRHMEAVSCSSRMHSLLLVCACLWPDDHNGELPSDFFSMSNEIGNPRILICPSDHVHYPASNWASLTTNNCSYELLAPGARKGTNNIAILRCKIHGYVGYSDDTLLDASGRLIKPNRMW